MHIGWPEGLYIVLTLMGILYMVSQHGRISHQPYNAVYTLASYFFITLPLLIWGGFFS